MVNHAHNYFQHIAAMDSSSEILIVTAIHLFYTIKPINRLYGRGIQMLPRRIQCLFGLMDLVLLLGFPVYILASPLLSIGYLILNVAFSLLMMAGAAIIFLNAITVPIWLRNGYLPIEEISVQTLLWPFTLIVIVYEMMKRRLSRYFRSTKQRKNTVSARSKLIHLFTVLKNEIIFHTMYR